MSCLLTSQKPHVQISLSFSIHVTHGHGSVLWWHHHRNHFAALFPGRPGWGGARRELLDFIVQGKINRVLWRHAALTALVLCCTISLLSILCFAAAQRRCFTSPASRSRPTRNRSWLPSWPIMISTSRRSRGRFNSKRANRLHFVTDVWVR